MAPSKQQDTREETRKQTSHRRREEVMNRRVLIGLAVVAALVVLLIAAGVISELVIKPSRPVATIANAKIGLREYQKRVKFDWFQAGQVTDPQGTSLKTLDTMVDDQLLREQAAAARHHGFRGRDQRDDREVVRLPPRAPDADSLADTRSGRDAEHRANRHAGPQPYAGLT